MGGLMDYKARFYSPYINHFTQPDTVVPNPINPQLLNRYSYVSNRPLNFNDPSGHARCGDGERINCDGNLNSHSLGGPRPNPHVGCGGMGQRSCGGNLPQEDKVVSIVSNEGPSIIYDDRFFDFDPARTIIDPDLTFDPFYYHRRVLDCATNTCHIRLYEVPGEYRIDWSRVDRTSLAVDVAGLIASVIGLGPVMKALKLTTKAEVTAIKVANFNTSAVSLGLAAQKRDITGVALTIISFYPPASVAGSLASVLNDLSDAVCFVPDQPASLPTGHIYGPPNLPNCDTNGPPCN
jgi:RHS repeat-associated protein